MAFPSDQGETPLHCAARMDVCDGFYRASMACEGENTVKAVRDDIFSAMFKGEIAGLVRKEIESLLSHVSRIRERNWDSTELPNYGFGKFLSPLACEGGETEKLLSDVSSFKATLDLAISQASKSPNLTVYKRGKMEKLLLSVVVPTRERNLASRALSNLLYSSSPCYPTSATLRLTSNCDEIKHQAGNHVVSIESTRKIANPKPSTNILQPNLVSVYSPFSCHESLYDSASLSDSTVWVFVSKNAHKGSFFNKYLSDSTSLFNSSGWFVVNKNADKGSFCDESLPDSPKLSRSGDIARFRGILRIILLVAGLLACLLALVPYDTRDGIRVPKESIFKAPVSMFHLWVISILSAFNGSFFGLKLKRRSPKLAVLSGYVALFTFMLALGLLTLFTVMWALDQM